MLQTDHRAARSRPLLVVIAIVAATFGAGFALGRHPEAGNVARLAGPVAPAAASASVAVHDDSLPDTADTLSHERLRDDDATPTF